MRSFSSNACDVLLDSQALERCYFQITFTQRPVLSSAAADMVTTTWLGLCCTFHLCKRFPFFTFSYSEMSLSHCNVTLVWHKGCGYQQTGSVPLDWVFVVLIPKRSSSSSAWDVTLIYTFTFTDVTLRDTKAAAISRLGQSHLIGSLLYFSSVWEVPLRVRSYFHIATSLWCDTKAD